MELHLLVAVVEYRTKLLRPRWGVCSMWLASLASTPTCRPAVALWVKPGNLSFQAIDSSSVIMVGPGKQCIIAVISLDKNVQD